MRKANRWVVEANASYVEIDISIAQATADHAEVFLLQLIFVMTPLKLYF